MNSRYRRERRQPPYYLLTGLILGLAFGFLITKVLFPVTYVNVPPETLQMADKDQYRLMIAQAFQANGDLGRVQARLGLLREENQAEILREQAQRSASREQALTLLHLAENLENPSQVTATLAVPSPTILVTATGTPPALPTTDATGTAAVAIRTATPQPTSTSASTEEVKNTPQPTLTPVISVNIPFRLVEEKPVCNPALTQSLIQVEVFDNSVKPIPNIRVVVTWDNGQDTFYTGYYPEISVGYADFNMAPTITYSVRVGEIGELVSNIQASECTDDNGDTYMGSVYLRFDEP
jgi:hypothetical protein